MEKSVGTIGDTYFTKGTSSEENDYDAYFSVVFKDTNESDYNELIAHYQTTSIGTDEKNMLLFDWGHIKFSLIIIQFLLKHISSKFIFTS